MARGYTFILDGACSDLQCNRLLTPVALKQIRAQAPTQRHGHISTSIAIYYTQLPAKGCMDTAADVPVDMEILVSEARGENGKFDGR